MHHLLSAAKVGRVCYILEGISRTNQYTHRDDPKGLSFYRQPKAQGLSKNGKGNNCVCVVWCGVVCVILVTHVINYWSIHPLIVWLTEWRTDVRTDWPSDVLMYGLIDRVTYWCTDWLTKWRTNVRADWLIDCYASFSLTYILNSKKKV